MEARYLGHSAVILKGSRTIVIDPFLTGNPVAAIQEKDITEADFVIATHDHQDHIGDSFAICKRTGATFVAAFEVAGLAEAEGIAIEPMGIGGSIESNGVRFHMTNAAHSSHLAGPTGMIVEMDGKTVYHMGDTGLIPDFALLPEFFSIDLAFVPIGDRFTMGGPSAARAVAMCGAKMAVPVHYATWPLLDSTADRFVESVGDGADVRVLAPGESLNL
jgi:L-ascorbate metabolism protein UlaG (beta-lactamase superfamily)